ncbi:hypothetical protein DPMN_165010 [Dreissena polymorpha]|uniref:Uncharacterized protein n=1 Tax=Dreissena polymorpha TaxID=45954 RepID=A0A9D4EUL2_DREPO|nr:hypothetical protein DPMN_165010 [Dreissena polymorpha]
MCTSMLLVLICPYAERSCVLKQEDSLGFGEGHQKLKVGFPPGTLSKKLVSRPVGCDG